jgi:ankyrin repeat protein
MDFKEQLKDAICNNNIEFLEQNKNKYCINARFEDEDNDTLLLYSISDKDSSAYQYFLRNSADKYLVNNENENIFHAIVYSNNKNRLKEIIDQDISIIKIINNRTLDGVTPLLLSISLEYFAIAELLIKIGANVNIADNDGITPIHLASQFGTLNFVKALINKGADIKSKTIKGNYPLALAVNADNYEVIRYLYNKIRLSQS